MEKFIKIMADGSTLMYDDSHYMKVVKKEVV